MAVVFWSGADCTLSKHDAWLFKQPNITRLRISYVDFSAFKDVGERFLPHKNLRDLSIEVRFSHVSNFCPWVASIRTQDHSQQLKPSS